jgi:hypothetical protein
MYQFESSGNSLILIRALSAINLLGVTYAAGDVVAYFNNAYFTLSFSNNNKSITQGPVNLLNFNTMALDRIQILQKTLDYNFYNFIAAKKTEDKNIFIPIKESVKSDSTGTVFFTRTPVNTKPVFIKNKENANVTGYTIDYQTGLITNLAVNTEYEAYYYYQDVSLIGFDLSKIETPYFKIEISGENNVNGISRYMFIEIPKTSIDIQTFLDFSKNNLAAGDLTFKIIEGIANITYY